VDTRPGDIVRVLDQVRSTGAESGVRNSRCSRQTLNVRWPRLNLAGVLVLVALCVLQWRGDRALNLEVNRLEKTRLSQETKIAEQVKNLHGLNDDLALFEEELTRAQSELGESRKKLQELERSQPQLATERDQLKESVTNWANAVAARDERLATANTRIQELADQLNGSIQKFNELATNYNAIVQNLNELRGSKTNNISAGAAR
jgi:chromosome segregation ATPase